MMDEGAVLRIGEVARRTGVMVATLRAWERRYGLLTPQRTEGGHRLYSEADVARVQAMQHLLDEGWSAAPAAREVLREPAPVAVLRPVPGTGDAASDLTARVLRAVEAFDLAGVDAAVDDVLARLDVPRALDEVILPLLRQVGDGWQDDPAVIAREHFASNALRPRLQRLLGRPVRADARSCLAVAPEGEEHDLGLLASCAVAADAGWRVHYLGARVPSRTVERSAAELRPTVVLVGALHRRNAEAFLADPPRLERPAFVLGGAGFLPGDESRLAGGVLHQGPIAAVPAAMERAVAARGVG